MSLETCVYDKAMYSHSSWSLAVTVSTVCWMSSFSSTSASYSSLSKYGGLSFLSAMPIRMNFVTEKKKQLYYKGQSYKYCDNNIEKIYMCTWKYSSRLFGYKIKWCTTREQKKAFSAKLTLRIGRVCPEYQTIETFYKAFSTSKSSQSKFIFNGIYCVTLAVKAICQKIYHYYAQIIQ